MQVNNKVDTCVLFFCEKNLKKKSCFCVNKFYGFIKIHKIWLLSKKNVFSTSEKIQKNGFSFYFFLKIRWCFILNKKQKIEKMNVVFVFFKKKYFLSVKRKVVKRKWHVGNKKVLLKKNDDVENKKKVVFFYEKCLFE